MVRIFFSTIGFAQNYLDEIKGDLERGLRSMTEVHDVQQCDVIVGICTIVSRVGTDVEAALREIPASKPLVLLVLHHTFDKDYVLPDTQRYMGGRGQTVNLLFHEDQGLLFCQANAEAKDKAVDLISRHGSPDRGYSIWDGASSVREGYSLHAKQAHKNVLVIVLVFLFVIIAIYALISSFSESSK